MCLQDFSFFSIIVNLVGRYADNECLKGYHRVFSNSSFLPTVSSWSIFRYLSRQLRYDYVIFLSNHKLEAIKKSQQRLLVLQICWFYHSIPPIIYKSLYILLSCVTFSIFTQIMTYRLTVNQLQHLLYISNTRIIRNTLK